VVTNYYLRITALDRPGVLARIAGILGERDISIVSVIQKGVESVEFVPVVMLTHEARESNVRSAVQAISRLSEVSGTPAVIRVEDKDLKNAAVAVEAQTGTYRRSGGNRG
jgi:homoserine dehydrogenase